MVYALILWRSALGLLMGKFRLFLTVLSAHNTSVFYIKDNNLSKFQWIFTRFDMCIYIVEICFGIAHWQISSIFDRVNVSHFNCLSPSHPLAFLFSLSVGDNTKRLIRIGVSIRTQRNIY